MGETRKTSNKETLDGDAEAAAVGPDALAHADDAEVPRRRGDLEPHADVEPAAVVELPAAECSTCSVNASKG